MAGTGNPFAPSSLRRLHHYYEFLRTFKHFYTYFNLYLKKEFPKLISYDRFVYLKKNLFIPLFAYLLHRRGVVRGISFIDSTSTKVCHNKRISRNKVFNSLAKRGKTTSGWFYGFKLHLIINDKGEILAFQLTPGNVSDVSMVETLSRGLIGKLFGDKGYISTQLTESLLKQGLELFTSIRSNQRISRMCHSGIGSYSQGCHYRFEIWQAPDGTVNGCGLNPNRVDGTCSEV